MWLVVGLGNPGVEYSGTYHNVGFRVLDRLAGRHHLRANQHCGPSRFSGVCELDGQTFRLVFPATFMNRSGLALPPLLERFDVILSSLIVVCDDLALPVGRIRIRQKGSSGGHNGLKSVISTLGSNEFIRVRVGIQPGAGGGDSREYVLSQVTRSDRQLLDQAEDLAADAVGAIVTGGVEQAMSRFNGLDLREPGGGDGPAKD